MNKIKPLFGLFLFVLWNFIDETTEILASLGTYFEIKNG